MSFQGWPEEALDFYDGLEADNSKVYWTANKAVYEEFVLGPMTALVEELAPEFGEFKIFRPYRDVRFSRDKSPYKTNIAAVIGDGYVSFSAKGLEVGSGMYSMEPSQLQRYRAAVADDSSGTALEKLVTVLNSHGIEVRSFDRLKSAPRGYPADHPRIGLLRYKGIITWREWPVEPWLDTSEAKIRIAEFLRYARPLDDWLAEHVR